MSDQAYQKTGFLFSFLFFSRPLRNWQLNQLSPRRSLGVPRGVKAEQGLKGSNRGQTEGGWGSLDIFLPFKPN